MVMIGKNAIKITIYLNTSQRNQIHNSTSHAKLYRDITRSCSLQEIVYYTNDNQTQDTKNANICNCIERAQS